MADDVVRARRRMTSALLLLVLAVTAFGASFYLLDGVGLVKQFLEGGPVVPGPRSDSGTTDEPTTTVDPLEDVPSEFALRVWQEQLDSQETMKRLFAGDIVSIEVGEAEVATDTALLPVEVSFADKTSAPGSFTFLRFDEHWYLGLATGMRREGTGGVVDGGGTAEEPPTPLPRMSDVDRTVLATIFAEQQKSQAFIEAYLSGAITRVDVLDIVDGPKTKTIKVRTIEEDGFGEADVVFIATPIGGTETWFLVRFEKTS